ncbi:U1-like zinc finger [Branchiostoma belcheri]|nr:U1-like zinc finger [Branchiostoma belcheri]
MVPASDIQVTIQQGGEGRTVNDDRPGQQSPEQQKIYICYACNAKCYNLRNYEAHMTGNRHRQQMLKIQEFTQMRVQQATAHMQARMKAEQHLRKIEGQGLGSTSSSGSGRHSSLSSGKRMKAEQRLRKIEGQGLGSTSGSGSGRHSSLSSGKRMKAEQHLLKIEGRDWDQHQGQDQGGIVALAVGKGE